MPVKCSIYNPHNPTSAYTTRDSQLISPNKNATRSNRKNPINPQFIAPMIVSVKAVQSKHLFPIIKSNLLDVKCKEFQYSIYKKKDFMYKVLKTLKYIYV